MTKKFCKRCEETKPLDAFYANRLGEHGVATYCKDCDNARPRKGTSGRINRQRARNRAVADLIDFHRDEFESLLSIRLAEAAEEAEALSEAPAAKEHYKSEPVRLRPGPRRAGQTTAERIDVARCPHCIKHHDRGHACLSCGARPTAIPSSPLTMIRSAPSGARRNSTSVDPAALAAFNAGTARAREAVRK